MRRTNPDLSPLTPAVALPYTPEEIEAARVRREEWWKLRQNGKLSPSEALSNRFLKEAQKAGFDGLKGHRLVGGFRASIYNAFPEAGVAALCEFMAEFERTL